MKSLYTATALLFLFIVLQSSRDISESEKKDKKPTTIAPPMEMDSDKWVDSVFNQMTPEQRVAQLFMISVYSNRSEPYESSITDSIAKYQPGGVIFMQGGPLRQAILNNRIQSVSKVPMLVSIDGEWGLKMRLDSVPPFPRQMQLGAISNNQLIYEMGAEIARQCKLLGIHINFAPVIDVNNNKANPVINSRSFGQDLNNVTQKGLAYAQGMQENRVLAVGKHFPGHGDTDVDSHLALPIINKSEAQLAETEFYPFKTLINNGIGGIMVAHISLPQIEPDTLRPATLSPKVIDTILRTTYQFKGLVFTDALNMKGVTKNYKPGIIEIEAILAGNDILLFPGEFEKAVNSVLMAVDSGIIKQSVIDERCKKILKTKKWAGLDQYKPVNLQSVRDSLVLPQTLALNSKLIRESISILQSEPVLPIQNIDKTTLLSISLGTDTTDYFQKQLSLYGQFETLQLNANSSDNLFADALLKAQQANVVIVTQHGQSHNAKQQYGIQPKCISFADTLAQLNKTIMVLLSNPYAIEYYNHADLFKAVCLAYHFDSISQSYAAQAIMGGIPVSGKLPVTINEKFMANSGATIEKAIRLGYESPEYFGIPAKALQKADSIINLAIANSVMPGAQLVFAKEGKVMYLKNYGHHTYENNKPVSTNDIYDIASVTKVAATTLAMVRLYDENRISPVQRLSKYLPAIENSNKKKLHINEIMAHQAGLQTWIPFYKNTLDKNGQLRPELYSKTLDSAHQITVCNSLFLRSDYRDSVYSAIVNSPLYPEKKYRYSDLGFYLLSRAIENVTNQEFDFYLHQTFYGPMGMNNTLFNPYTKIDLNRIPPTENDVKFRGQVVKGYVNDQGAAIIGGVSGHAGLFSNANDLAKLGQLFLNKGTYGGITYFNPNSFEVFNKAYFTKEKNRRGLGFDKPSIDPAEMGPACPLASEQSFGHSGFTGSYIWVDPANHTVFVFNTNRTFPDPENKKLAETNLRTDLQQLFYNFFSK